MSLYGGARSKHLSFLITVSIQAAFPIMSGSPIRPGTYLIRNVASGTFMELEGGSNANSTRVLGYAQRNNSYSAQLWVFSKVGGDVYTIKNASTGTYLDLSGSISDDGTPIIGYQDTGNQNQQWKVIPSSAYSNCYLLQNKYTETYADMYLGDSADGTAVTGWGGEGEHTQNTHQLWDIIES